MPSLVNMMAYRIISNNLLKPNFYPNRTLLKFKGNLTMSGRSFFQQPITKNIEIISNHKILIDSKPGKLPLVTNFEKRPLVIMLSWILADKKHLQKFWDIYLKRNYDVVTVSITVMQFLWPTTGAQVVAQDLLDFLYENSNYNPLLIHGFSIGGYVWGEVLVKMEEDLVKYNTLIDRFVGQVWDSTPDVTEVPKGFPMAVFPTSPFFRSILEKIISFHLSKFSDSATQHYLRASQTFHAPPVKAPALIFVAENDTIASLKSIMKAKESWDSLGMKTNIKSWEKSQHVSHFHLHREEYLDTLEGFLSTLGLPELQEAPDNKIQAKL